jgi:hypothetical protein
VRGLGDVKGFKRANKGGDVVEGILAGWSNGVPLISAYR